MLRTKIGRFRGPGKLNYSAMKNQMNTAFDKKFLTHLPSYSMPGKLSFSRKSRSGSIWSSEFLHEIRTLCTNISLPSHNVLCKSPQYNPTLPCPLLLINSLYSTRTTSQHLSKYPSTRTSLALPQHTQHRLLPHQHVEQRQRCHQVREHRARTLPKTPPPTPTKTLAPPRSAETTPCPHHHNHSPIPRHTGWRCTRRYLRRQSVTECEARQGAAVDGYGYAFERGDLD